MSEHLDFCGGGEFCSLDDCLCECHVPAEMDAARLDRVLASLGIHIDKPSENTRPVGCESCGPAVETIAAAYRVKGLARL